MYKMKKVFSLYLKNKKFKKNTLNYFFFCARSPASIASLALSNTLSMAANLHL